MDYNISELAKAAGVSRATISRVINGNPAVKAKTAARVREVIDRMGYVRPAIRPGPKPRTNFTTRLRTGSIALIAIGGTSQLFQEPIMATLIGELQSACRKRQINLILDQMTSPEQIPLCAETRQIDGAILMVAGRPARRRECIAKLASLLPAVHLFTPGHPISSVDHVTVNDVAVGDMAFHFLKNAGCQSMAVVNANADYLEALYVRGRALGDRAVDSGIPVHYFAAEKASGPIQSLWPQPLTSFENFKTVAGRIQGLPGPVGVFLTLESATAELHGALESLALIGSGHAKLVVAGTTPFFVQNLQPAPQLIDLAFPDIIEVAVERLIHRAQNLPNQVLTFLVPPRLVG